MSSLLALLSLCGDQGDTIARGTVVSRDHAYAEAPTIVVETPAYVFPARRASQCMLGPNRTLTSCPTTSYWVGRDAMHQRATQVQRMLKARVSVQILLGGFRWRGWVC